MMIATVVPIIRVVLGIVGASFAIRDPRSANGGTTWVAALLAQCLPEFAPPGRSVATFSQFVWNPPLTGRFLKQGLRSRRNE